MASIINATTSTGLVSSADNSGSLQLATNNGTTAVTIDTSQNVGVGTTSPADTLNIGTGKKFRATHSASVYQQIFSSSSGNFITAYGDNLDISAAAGAVYLTTTASQPMVFQTNNTERMRIDSSGNVLVNTTSLNSGKVNIVASGSAQPCMIWNDSDATSGSQGIVSIRRNGSAVGLISTTNTNTTYATSSDYRLKENIAPMTGALATVSQLKPCTYTWKADGKDGQGFIAHELQAVVPDCVTGEKDDVETYTDEEGNEQTKPKYQGVDTSFLVATLTSAIQELNEKVEAQAVRIAELEGAK